MIAITKLDWSITSPEERLKLVEAILAENASPNLDLIGTYLTQSEKKDKKILTENRLVTINKRETSLDSLIEDNVDGIYKMMHEPDKHVIFKPKISITKQDLADIPALRQKREAINFWEKQLKTATGYRALIIKQTIVELRKDQYIIKDAFRQTIKFANLTRNITKSISLPSKEWINENDEVCYSGASLCDSRIIQQILCSYQSLRQKSRGDFLGDTWYLIEDFDRIYAQAMEPYPMYRRIVEYKMEGRGNLEIKDLLQQEFGYSHAIEYISTLWRKKIPRLIARQAQENFLMWYHETQVKSRWKKCTKCGQIKLEHNFFFSKNSTTSSGFYCVCKECRRKRVSK